MRFIVFQRQPSTAFQYHPPVVGANVGKKLDPVLLVHLANTHFSLSEITLVLDGRVMARLSTRRWRKLADRKLKEVDGIVERTQAESQ